MSEDANAPLTRADLTAAVQVFTERQDRAVEAIATSISELREELIGRLGRIEIRTERTEINTNALLMQVAGMSKSLTAAEQLGSVTDGTLAAIRRTLDQFAAQFADTRARLEALERKAS